MARRARAERTERPLPPPLPPAQRTVGQLVGEAIRAYAAQFWRALALGVPVVVANALVWARPAGDGSVALIPLTALLISLSYVLAIGLVTGVDVRSRHGVVAYLVAVVVFLPVPLLVAIFILPGVIWLAVFGLAVPAVLVEKRGVRDGRPPRVAAGTRRLRARRRRPRDARARRDHLAVQPVLRPPRVRGQHADDRGCSRIARRLPGRLPRQRASLRRPGGSVTLAGRSTKGVRCRPT